MPVELAGPQIDRAAVSPPVLVDARSDRDAIDEWLASVARNPNTFRAYRKETNRLLIWLEQIKGGLSLARMNRRDWADFQSWLASPGPEWCGPKRAGTSPEWRPFVQGLDWSQQRQALTILDGLLNWLVAAGYLRGNPLALIRLRVSRKGRQRVDRYLPEVAWAYLKSWLDRQTEQAAATADGRRRLMAYRTRALFYFLYGCAPRLFEVATASSGEILGRITKEGSKQWWWEIAGKGQTNERVPVPSWVMAALVDYRREMGWPPFPCVGESLPLIAPLNWSNETRDRTVSDRQVHNIVKSTLSGAAADCDDQEIAALFRSATTHWLRHTRITHLVNMTGDLRLGKAIARHGSVTTTEIYLHEDDNRLWQEAERQVPNI